MRALLAIRDPSTKEPFYKVAIGNIQPYTHNELTYYFDGLPIVDIAGPSSLASGYYLNALARFVLPGQLFDGKFSLSPVMTTEKDVPSPTSTISKFVIVLPPERMSNYPDDNKKFLDLLRKHGFRVEQRIIQDRSKKLRPYAGNFLARVNGNLLDPAVVIEIPTTLYALQRVPRIRRLIKSHPKYDVLRWRHIDGMLSSFQTALEQLMTEDNIGER